jgi:hypothetical protein
MPQSHEELISSRRVHDSSAVLDDLRCNHDHPLKQPISSWIAVRNPLSIDHSYGNILVDIAQHATPNLGPLPVAHFIAAISPSELCCAYMSAHVATCVAAGLRTELQVGRGGCQLIQAKMASKWRLHARYRKQRSRRSFMCSQVRAMNTGTFRSGQTMVARR